MIIFAAFSDGLDGYLARKFKTESPLGKIIDPIADKVFVVSALTAFDIKLNSMHLHILLFLTLAREILIISGYFHLKKYKSNFEVSPLFSSKLNTSFLFVFFLVHIFIFYLSDHVFKMESDNIMYLFLHPFIKGYSIYITLTVYGLMWLICVISNVWSGKTYVQFYKSIRKAS